MGTEPTTHQTGRNIHGAYKKLPHMLHTEKFTRTLSPSIHKFCII